MSVFIVHIPSSLTLAAPWMTLSFTTMIDNELLELLRCPLTGSRLRHEGDWLIAEEGGLAYPIRDGFPVMLVEEAKLPAGVAALDDLRAQYKDRIGHQ